MTALKKISKFYFILLLFFLFIGAKTQMDKGDVHSELVSLYIDLLEKEIEISQKLQLHTGVKDEFSKFVFKVIDLKKETLNLINHSSSKLDFSEKKGDLQILKRKFEALSHYSQSRRS